ncbi:MAG: undecaprenyl-diphosphate phosphatase [Candidatus Bathyarchaeota archaeon]|nr:undecaprenyl-diphosphate phosphatase [Candidatus Bathyarchaeota archaeon]
MRFETILLGLIQGLTEWLPISSTGHLRLFELLLGLRLPLLFEVILHIGTLAVTVLFFRVEVKKILTGLIRFDFRSKEVSIVPKIFVSLILSAAAGISINFFLKDIFYSMMPLGAAFFLSGLIIYTSKRSKCTRDLVDYRSAAIIGVMQGLSIIPGLSRSGLTISTALILGIKREEAFKFSFLLLIPSVFGALIALIFSEINILMEASLEPIDLFFGCFTAALSGYASLKILRSFLHKFHLFALYLLPLGFLLILIDLLAI